jgi:hypothetical protein
MFDDVPGPRPSAAEPAAIEDAVPHRRCSAASPRRRRPRPCRGPAMPALFTRRVEPAELRLTSSRDDAPDIRNVAQRSAHAAIRRAVQRGVVDVADVQRARRRCRRSPRSCARSRLPRPGDGGRPGAQLRHDAARETASEAGPEADESHRKGRADAGSYARADVETLAGARSVQVRGSGSRPLSDPRGRLPVTDRARRHRVAASSR